MITLVYCFLHGEFTECSMEDGAWAEPSSLLSWEENWNLQGRVLEKRKLHGERSAQKDTKESAFLSAGEYNLTWGQWKNHLEG